MNGRRFRGNYTLGAGASSGSTISPSDSRTTINVLGITLSPAAASRVSMLIGDDTNPTIWRLGTTPFNDGTGYFGDPGDAISLKGDGTTCHVAIVYEEA